MTSPHSHPRSRRRTPRRKVALRSSIGPVEDLESYVKAEWWRDIFNANYLRTDGLTTCAPMATWSRIRKSRKRRLMRFWK
jgi:D-alanine-D-alanine ligase